MSAFDHNVTQTFKMIREINEHTEAALLAGAAVLDEVYRGDGQINQETIDRMKTAWDALGI